MTNAELAVVLNTRFGLAGQDAVTENVVRQWVAWDVLPKAAAQGQAIGIGPTWFRSDSTLQRATRLAELRKHGVRREKALIVQAYIEWGHPDFDRVREALSSEWGKWAAQLTRRQTTFLEKSEFPNISRTKKRAIANQLGPLDFRFIGSQFEQTPEFYAAIAEFARNGDGSSEYIEALISGAFRQIMPGIEEFLPPHYILRLANSFAGITGDPDEIANSAESAIQKATERQFRITRHQVRLFIRVLRKGAPHGQSALLDSKARQLLGMVHSLAPQISNGPWLVFAFVQGIKGIVGK